MIDPLKSPIIIGAHGTGAKAAHKILSSGFASLSLVDNGYYGTGIYFSTHCIYTLPYFYIHKDPCIILCYLIPGNPYPVTENPDTDKGLFSSPLQSGYQSHYVVTNTKGYPYSPIEEENNAPSYDEIVIGQEGQILPVFLLMIDKTNLEELYQSFNRELPQYHKILHHSKKHVHMHHSSLPHFFDDSNSTPYRQF